LLFTSVLVGYARRVHDARILRNLQINDYMDQLNLPTSLMEVSSMLLKQNVI